MEVVDSSVAILLLQPRHKLAKIIYVILQRSVFASIRTMAIDDVAYIRDIHCDRLGQRRGTVQQEIAAASVDSRHPSLIGFRSEDDATRTCAGE